jgi:prepilin-type N-terminal cleavage/methylation domain-containing protein
MLFKKKKKGFTILELMIGMTVLSLLVTVVYDLFSGIMGSFDISQWKLRRQREMKLASKLLKEKIQQATYPSKIIFSNPDEKKNGLFYCTESFYLTSGKNDAPGYIPNGGTGDLPGKEEALQYLGDDGGIAGEDATFSMIYQPHAKDNGGDGPPIPASMQYPSINGKFYNIVDGAANPEQESPFSNCLGMSTHQCPKNAETKIMSFLMCKPRRETDAPVKGSIMRFDLFLKTGRDSRDPDQVDLVYDEIDLTDNSYKKRKNILIRHIYKIEIAHRLVPNEPPIGDFLPSTATGDPTFGFQFFIAGAAAPSIQTLAGNYYIANDSSQGLTDPAKDFCAKDMRRGSMIGMRFFMRPYRSNARTKRNILLVEELQEKTNVRVFDTAAL